MKSIGSIAFIIGLILAAFVSIFSAATIPTWSLIVMALLGVVVGLLNITDKEVSLFLIASIAFLISFQALSNVFTVLVLGWSAVGAFFHLMNVFVAPAAAIVAVVAIVRITRD